MHPVHHTGAAATAPASDNSAADASPPPPSELNAGAHGPGLEVGKDRLSLRYVGEGRHSNDVGAIQSDRPVPEHLLLFYFEVSVTDAGEHSRIGIGFSDKHFKLTRQPGWEAGSYGYHGDDGRKYAASGKGEEYGPRFGAGDTVGAGLHLGRREIFFTKNGVKLKAAFRGVPPRQLFPTVGLHSRHEAVRVNFGASPFKFDLEALVAEEREQQAAAVQRMAVPPRDVHAVARDYLLFNGYGDTLAAFDREVGGGGGAGADDGGGVQPMCEGDSVAGSDGMAATLALRQGVRRAIMAGAVASALEQLRQCCPSVLQGHPVAEQVQFQLRCQQYIEFIREARVTDAMQFAQTVLAGLKPGAAHSDSQLRDVVALIAYEQPDQSPLGHLLQLSQREAVADVVNAAILQASASPSPSTPAAAAVAAAAAAGGGGNGAGSGGAGGDGSGGGAAGGGAALAGGSMPQSVLEALLRQLAAARAALREEAGGIGEVFDLRAHLLPPGGNS